MTDSEATALARRQYDAYAPRYDRETYWYERIMLGDGRSWACSQAHGKVLEVAIGTGRNLPYYLPGTRLTGVELSPAMLARARTRAHDLSVQVEFVEGDAQELPFPDVTFDTVICTLGLSSIPDDRAAVSEMYRVLREDGHLVLLGHVASRVSMALGVIAATTTSTSSWCRFPDSNGGWLCQEPRHRLGCVAMTAATTALPAAETSREQVRRLRFALAGGAVHDCAQRMSHRSSPSRWRPSVGSRSPASVAQGAVIHELLENRMSTSQTQVIRLTSFSRGAGCACTLLPGVREVVSGGSVSGGTRANIAYLSDVVAVDADVPSEVSVLRRSQCCCTTRRPRVGCCWQCRMATGDCSRIW